jgi:hypothetical protein
MMRRTLRLATLAAALLLLPAAAAAQGAGSTGLEVAQVPTGARAGALAGAYTAVGDDADGLFYNPSSVGGPGRAASLSYQRHVMDITFGSLAGAFRVGPVALGAGVAFMDGGEVPEIVPDPDFGGQRGIPTGATVSARESAFRLAAAYPLLDERVLVGAGVGFALSELAGVSRSAAMLDVGAHFRPAPRASVGVALRNLGGTLSGGGAEDADLPLEARIGAIYRHSLPADLGVLLAADGIYRPREEIAAAAAGLEFGLMPTDGVGAVLRVGFRAEEAIPAANAVHLGAGISFAGVALDYQYQDLEFFGTAHRIGLRWRAR